MIHDNDDRLIIYDMTFFSFFYPFTSFKNKFILTDVTNRYFV